MKKSSEGSVGVPLSSQAPWVESVMLMEQLVATEQGAGGVTFTAAEQPGVPVSVTVKFKEPPLMG
jgi:hypothetical protein